jgi:hypothetical protein
VAIEKNKKVAGDFSSKFKAELYGKIKENRNLQPRLRFELRLLKYQQGEQ